MNQVAGRATDMPRLFKAHGLGNDYLVVDRDALPFSLTPPAVRLLCDRHHGIGSDGILAHVPAKAGDFGLRIFNPDGTEAEKSGNGLRIFAAYLLVTGRVLEGQRFAVETPGGKVEMELLGGRGSGAWMVEVEMGRASFRTAAVGLVGPDRDSVHEMLELPSGERIDCTLVSMGNPHCVVFQDELDVERLRRIAPLISTHPWFERGTNVQFARPDTTSAVEAWVWERGAGETLASGSSACAVGAAAVRRGLVSERQVAVRMPGGTLDVEVRDDWSVHLRGPVEEVAWIELATGLLQRLQRMDNR
jgi:diaminopimelate epimerase